MDSIDQLLEHCLSQALTSTAPCRLSQSSASAAAAPPVQILLPVCNAADALAACLASVLEHTPPDVPILLLDDASDDAATLSLLETTVAQHPQRCRWLRRQQNLGFVGNVNLALRDCASDVVVLNSDTVVHARWLQHLQHATVTAANIGLVCPVSDNATLLTVADSPLLADCCSEQLAGFCEQCAGDALIELPTAVGFCMYISQQTMQRIGLLDAAFAPGYGEEVDYSLRARAAGLRIVAAPRCFVSHRGSASFGDDAEIRDRRRLHERMVQQRWPDYVREVRHWWRDNPLLELREALKSCALKQRQGDSRRVLHITHNVDSIGGTEVFVDALLQRISPEYPATLVCVGQGAGWADQCSHGGDSNLEVIKLNADYRVVNQSIQSQAADLSNPWLERYFTRLLRQQDFAMVHVHYLIGWDSLLLPLLAKRLGVPVVISLHCHYHLCPDYNMMLRPDLVPCQQPYAGASDSCIDCLQPRYQSRPQVKVPPLSVYLQARRRFSSAALQAADRIVVPSQYLAEAIADGLGASLRATLEVIAHGVDSAAINSQAVVTERDTDAATLQILFCGGDYLLKGYELVLQLIEHAREHELKLHFHIAGECRNAPARLPSSVTVHDGLPHELLLRLMQQMDLLLLPSRYQESFSILLSEAWSCGVVPMASDHGALADRISDALDGFLLPPFAVQAWQHKLDWLASGNGRKALAEMRQRLLQQAHRNMDECASDYLQLYQRVMTSGTGKPEQLHEQIAADEQPGTRLSPPQPADCRIMHPPSPAMPDAQLPELIVLIDCSRNAARGLDDTLASVQALAATVVLLDDPATSPSSLPTTVCRLRATAVTDLAALIAQHPTAWLVWVEAGDLLHAGCRHWLASYLPLQPAAVYCNHDHVSATGRFYAPALKPDRDLACMQHVPVLQHGLFIHAAVWQRAGQQHLTQDAAVATAQLAIQSTSQQVLHLPQILYHRLDQNITLDCQHDQRGNMMRALQARKLIGNGSVTSGKPALGMGWQQTCDIARPLRVHVCLWYRAAPESPALSARWQALLDAPDSSLTLSLETVSTGKLATLPDLHQCDYLLHVHDGIVGLNLSSLRTLLACAEQHQATATAPRLRLRSGASLPLAYSACSTGLYRSLTAVAAETGLHALAFERAVSRHADVLADCVLLNCRHFRHKELRDDNNRHSQRLLQQWPRLVVSTRLAAYPIDCNALAVGTVTLHSESRAEALQDKHGQSAPISPPRYLQDPWRWHVEIAGSSHQRLTDADRPSRRFRHPGKLPVLSSVVSNGWAAAQYRVLQPLQALQAQELIDQHHCHRLDQRAAPDAFALGLLQTDVLLCLHWLDDHALQQMQLARNSLPLRIVLLIDDLLTALPDYNPYVRHIPADIDARLASAAKLADRVIVTSDGLARAYADLHPDLRVIPNALPDQPWKLLQTAAAKHTSTARSVNAKAANRKLRIGWAGGAQHDADLAILEPVMRATAAQVDWVLLGHCPAPLRDLLAEHHPAVSFAHYPQRLFDLQLDVAVAPLQDNPFNRCKSMLKILEYAALGVPVIASRVGAYAGTPALCVDNHSSAWTAAIMRCVDDAGLRLANARQLQRWVREQHMLSQRLPDWADALCRWD
ncbi:MAG: glycosyltransferase [Gammaproteobacteria bacterium]|nr:glycosyltransferase [Gammaproteobacteria bacterium]